MQRKEEKSIWKVLFVVLAAVSVFAAFVLFIKDNNRRATTISINSLEDATESNSQRIDEILNRARSEISLTSNLYEEMLEEPVITMEDLQTLAEKSSFDHIEYVDMNGIDINPAGETADVSDRQYYLDGIQGNSGVEVVFNSRINGENLIVFYAPLYYDGEQIGVLLGHYGETQIQEILENTVFNEEARSFLCMRDGTIIASYNGEYVSESIFEEGTFNHALSEDVEEELRDALLTGEEYAFQYEGTKGTGNAYMSALGNTDWILIQTYPSQVTSKIVSEANRAGIILLVELILISLVCILLLQVASSIQKRRLEIENTEQSYVVNGTAKLFRAFIYVNLENGTYQFLGGTKPRQSGFPLKGSYDAWRNYLLNLMDEEDIGDYPEAIYTREDLQKNLSDDTPYLRREYRVKNGGGRWDSINVICLNRVDGVATEVLFAYQDVTKGKERELRNYEAMREAYHAAESANQAKSNFLSNMSHDIRTPMNAIMGMTAIAAMNIDNTERVKDCLNKITLSSQHLLGLINEVLDMSKIESGKMNLSEEEFNLSDVVENIIAMFLPQTQGKQQIFKVNIADVAHEEVIGDSMRLQQIFVNIIGNSVKFTPAGGRITLNIAEKSSGMHGYGCYVFTFEDTGIGMEESFLEHLFEPFTRAKNSSAGKMEGTGLGMPIVKNIVQMMNGDIQVETKLNEGTRFTVTIYLRLNHSNHDDVEGLENLTVLVADDDQFACESACGILQEIGMDADWVLSGDEAVQSLLEAQSENHAYSAVILDWKMPGKDGIETAREIRAKVGEDVPIIILSAYDYSVVEQEAREAGVNAFISKPMFRSRLVHVMKTLVLGEEDTYAEVEQLQQRNYSGKRVLLVEDNELNMEIAEELLMQAGVTVDKAVNGQQAVERVNEMPAGFYNLVFMDIQMPEMNGYDATKAIRHSEREDLKTLPIIAMTADAFTDDVKRAKSVGMNGHIAKPVEIEKLLQAMDEWM